MPKEPQTRLIDGFEYEVTQLGFTEGRRALVRLIRAIGPTLGKALQNVDNKLDFSKIKNLEDVKVSVAGQIVEELSTCLTDEHLDYFCKVFGDNTLVSVSPANRANKVPLDMQWQERHFQGNYTSFFKWLWFCLEVNFAGFTDGLGALSRNGSPAEGSPSS